MAEKMHKVIPEKYPSMASERKMKYYPTFRLGDDDLPELKGMEVGKKYTLVMQVEVMSKMQGDEYNQQNPIKTIKGTLKVMKVGLEEKEPTTSGKKFEMEYAKKRGGGTGSRFDK